MYTRVLNLVDLLASDTQVILRRVLLVGTQVLLETEYHLSISRKTVSGSVHGAGEALASTAGRTLPVDADCGIARVNRATRARAIGTYLRGQYYFFYL